MYYYYHVHLSSGVCDNLSYFLTVYMLILLWYAIPFYFYMYVLSRLILKLIRPMLIEQGQRFTLRDGHVTTGTGVITNILPSLSEEERTLILEGKKSRQKREQAAK